MEAINNSEAILELIHKTLKNDNMDTKLLRVDIKKSADILALIYEEMTKDKDIESEDDLSQDEFLKLKDKYGSLYFTEINGEEFLFRDLSRAEYSKAISRFENEAAAEEYICKQAVILPNDFNYEECLDAGIPSTLAGQILYESGFDESNPKAKAFLKQFREEMNLLENQIPCIIKEAFQDLSFDEIESWSLEKTLKYYTRAEYILNVLQRRDLEFIYLYDEEEIETNHQIGYMTKDDIGGDMDSPHARAMKAFLEGKLENDEIII